jgi:hypothetical protein
MATPMQALRDVVKKAIKISLINIFMICPLGFVVPGWIPVTLGQIIGAAAPTGIRRG